MEVHPDPYPDLVVERGPEDAGVGSWVPEHKHRLLRDYVIASQPAYGKWKARVFVDPFGGPGRVQVKGESFTRDGGAVVAWRSLKANRPRFSEMLVGDLRPERSDACARRLAALGAPAVAFTGQACDTVLQMVQRIPKSSLTLAYLDPYNLELLHFSIIQALASLRVDLAINFCTMDLQRNAEFEFDPKRARFDKTAPGWRDDPAIRKASKRNVPIEFFRYWCRLVEGLGFQYSREMPLVPNDQGHPIYRMVFFARHDLPVRLWGDVARDRNLELF